MKKEAIDFNDEWMNRTWDTYELKIEEIFYSKNIDSCIYQLSVYKDSWEKDWAGNMKFFLLNKYLYDYFSKKEIASTTGSGSTELKEIRFDNKIKELKWE